MSKCYLVFGEDGYLTCIINHRDYRNCDLSKNATHLVKTCLYHSALGEQGSGLDCACSGNPTTNKE